MKRKMMLIGVIMITLACNIPTVSNPGTVQSTSQPSAGTLVEAMNVSVADVPGFETAESNDIVLYKEALAEDHVIYVDEQQRTTVNSVVMQLPNAPDSQVIEELFVQARQNAQSAYCAQECGALGDYGGEISLGLGDLGKLRWIEAACGKVYVAVVARGNYATVVVACGPAVDEQFVSLLAALVDTRVVSLSSGGPSLSGGDLTPYPPPPTEDVTPQPTDGAYPPPGTPEAGVDCAALSLTEEECVNAGSDGHNYILVDIIAWVDGKKQDTKTLNVPVRFLWPFPNPMVHQQKQCLVWNKTQANTYECLGGGGKTYSIIFTKDGFLMIQEWRDREAGVVLKTQSTYVFAP